MDRDDGKSIMSKIEPLAAEPNEGEIFNAGPFHIVTRLTGEQTGGTFELYDVIFAPGTVDYHIHRHMDETLILLEGELEFTIAGETYLRKAGSVAFAPKGVHHGFKNHGPGKARLLILFSPAGNQNTYFRELAKLFAGEVDAAKLKALQVQYDQELVPLP